MSQHDEIRKEIDYCLRCAHSPCRCRDKGYGEGPVYKVPSPPPPGALGHAAGIGLNAVHQSPEIDDRHTFASGAMSSGRKPRYDLIPTEALARIAARFEYGAIKYGENNWQKGVHDKAYILDRINHAIEHLMNLKDHVHYGDRLEELVDDDAAAIILNVIFVMEYQHAASRK